jgi:phage-related protein
MSKALSVASIIEKNRLSSDVPFLILLDIDVVSPDSGAVIETGHYVRNTEAVNFNGNAYEPANFDIEFKEESGQLQTVKLSIKDYAGIIQQKMQDYGGGVGFGVTVSVANSAALDKPAEIQEFFEVVAAESSQYVCAFTLGAENTVAKTFPRRRQTRDYCQWRYKGEECGYSGGMPSCDLTLKGANGCVAHGNVIRFGAFPGINTRDVNYG